MTAAIVGFAQLRPARGAEDARPLAAHVRGALLGRHGHDVRAGERVLEVAARAERVLAGPGEHADQGRVVVAEARPGVDQLGRGDRSDGVHALGPVERDHRHRAVLLVADLSVVHGAG